MKVSSTLSPFPWYTDVYDQDKYQSDCPECIYELITDKTRLLPFQFRRKKSGYPVSEFFLRDACKLYWQPVAFYAITHFVNDTGDFTIGSTSVMAGGVLTINTTLTPSDWATSFNPAWIDPAKNYRIKIVVSEWKDSGTNLMQLHDSTDSNILSITGVGTYIFDFGGSLQPYLHTEIPTAGDYVKLSEISIYEEHAFDAMTDISINYNLSLVNVGDSDYVTYCGDQLDVQLPCGKYYACVKMADGQIFFSEIFTVMNFIPEQSKYVLLEWSNTCDIKDVLYTEPVCKTFTNRMYVDGPLTKPEYPITINSEEDGDGIVHPTFRKLEKTIILGILKSPEFIIDAISGIALHDSVNYTAPIRRESEQVYGQLEVEAPVNVDAVKSEFTWIFNDCRANISLSMTIDRITLGTCCDNLIQSICFTCKYSIRNLEEYYIPAGAAYVAGVFYVYHPGGAGLPGNWVPTDVIGDSFCITTQPHTPMYYNYPDGWFRTPSVDSLTDTGHSYIIKGHAFPGTYVKFKVFVFDIDFGSSYELPTIYTDTDYASGIEIPYTDIPTAIPTCGYVSFVPHDFSLNCTYPDGETSEAITYDSGCSGYDPDAQAWFEAMTIQPSDPYKNAINVLVTALKSYSVWNKLDRLWIHATEENQHAMIDLKSLQNLTEHGTTWNPNVGYTGDGVSAYLDLNYIQASDAVNMLQNDAAFGVYCLTNIFESAFEIGAMDANYKTFAGLGYAGNFYFPINMSTSVGSPGAGITDSSGMFSAVRTSGSSSSAYRNGSSISANAVASAGLTTTSMFVLAINSAGTAGFFSTKTIAMSYIGAGSINQSQFYTAFQNFAATIGFNV